MATNQFFYIPEFKTVATVSNPSSGFVKLYKKTTGSHWYTVDDQGNEKQIGISVLLKNGLVSSSVSPSSIFDAEINLSIGNGLTFSSNTIGSSVSVANLSPSMLNVSTASQNGYVLSSTASGNSFQWIPFTVPGINGSVNKVPKFDTSTSITDSLMSDDGTSVIIGVTPSLISTKFANDGDQFIGGKLFFKDDSNLFIQSSNGLLIQTDEYFRVQDELGYAYLNIMTDNTGLSGVYTFSVLNNTINIIDQGGYRTLSSNTLDLINFGTTSATMSFNLYGTGSVLRIKDGSEGSNKVFVSDITGLGTWISLTSDYINIIGPTNSLTKYTGSGLTSSFLYEGPGGTASSRYLGYGSSFSSSDLPLRPIHIKVNDSTTTSKLAIHNYNTTNNNADVISFRTDTTGASASSFIEFAAIRANYEDHADNNRKGSLAFYTRNSAISYTFSNLTLSLNSDGNVYIPGTQSGFSALQFGSMTSSSSTTFSSVALSVDGSGRVILTSIAAIGGNISSPYDKGLTANSVIKNGGTASNSTISVNPVIGSYVSVFVNGQEIEVGNGTTSSSCYFGTHSSMPKGFSASNAIQSGDYLYWNPILAGFNLESGWRISLHYLIQS